MFLYFLLKNNIQFIFSFKLHILNYTDKEQAEEVHQEMAFEMVLQAFLSQLCNINANKEC